jgi:hypothetical protein
LLKNLPWSSQHYHYFRNVLEADIVRICFGAFLFTPYELVLVDVDDETGDVHDADLPVLFVFQFVFVHKFDGRAWLHRNSGPITTNPDVFPPIPPTVDQQLPPSTFDQR